MPFVKMPGVTGKVYVPEQVASNKKHACPDCFSCQNCSSERCHLCRSATPASEDAIRNRSIPPDACSCGKTTTPQGV